MKTPLKQLKELVEHMAIHKIVKSREASEEKEIPFEKIEKDYDL